MLSVVGGGYSLCASGARPFGSPSVDDEGGAARGPDGGRDASPGGWPVTVACFCITVRRAVKASVAVANRSSRCFARHLPTKLSMLAGHCSPVALARGGGSVSSFADASMLEVIPSNGSLPTNARNTTDPMA